MRALFVAVTAAAAATLSAVPLRAQWAGSDHTPNCRYVERVVAGRVIRHRVCDTNGRVYGGRDGRIYDRNGNVIYDRDGVYRRGDVWGRRDDRDSDSDYRKARKRAEKERREYEKARREYERARAKLAKYEGRPWYW